MELKDRFANHIVEPDQEAWEHFVFLRKNKKRKRGFFFWSLWGSAFFGAALVIGIFLWQKNSESAIANSSTASKSKIENQREEKSIEKNEATIDNSVLNKELSSNANNEITSNELQSNKLEKTATNNTLFSNQTPTVGTESDQLLIDNTQTINIDTKVNADQQTDGKIVPPAILEKEEKTEAEKSVTINSAVQVSSLPSILSLVVMEDTMKRDSLPPLAFDSLFLNKDKRPMNVLKLTGGYTDGFIQGFSLENEVNKVGFGINLEYRRDLSRLIGVGLSTGYWQGVDIANPMVENRDSEKIKYLHANLYLYLVNAYKHRLLVKVGGGLTSTNRYLGTFFFDNVTNTLERRFQFSNFNSFGFVVEGAYEYQISKKWMVGTSFSLLQHNDGGWLAGLSLGYNF